MVVTNERNVGLLFVDEWRKFFYRWKVTFWVTERFFVGVWVSTCGWKSITFNGDHEWQKCGFALRAQMKDLFSWGGRSLIGWPSVPSWGYGCQSVGGKSVIFLGGHGWTKYGLALRRRVKDVFLKLKGYLVGDRAFPRRWRGVNFWEKINNFSWWSNERNVGWHSIDEWKTFF